MEIKLWALRKVPAALAAASSLLISGLANASPLTNEKSACSAVKARVAETKHTPMQAIAFCDFVSQATSPAGYYVLALHGKRRDCTGICSTNMGWFAVRKATGEIFEWDVAEQRLSLPLS